MNYRFPGIPESPKCYTENHPDRIEDVSERVEVFVDSFNRPQNEWRHELDHDVESVFWLLLYWAMVMQPEGGPGECLHAPTWMSLLGDFKDREGLVVVLSNGEMPNNLIHSVYKPLWPLISSLADILLIDRHWIPGSNVRKRPEYICEAFQRLILKFIVENRDEDFMTCRVGNSLRQVPGVTLPRALSTTPSPERDGSEREGEVKLCLREQR